MDRAVSDSTDTKEIETEDINGVIKHTNLATMLGKMDDEKNSLPEAQHAPLNCVVSLRSQT